MKPLLRFLAILMGVVVVLCCSNDKNHSDRAAEATEKTIRRAIGAEPTTLDPARAIDNFSSQIIYDLYEGLTALSPDGEVIPGIASSWKVDSSAMQYTFTLRGNAKWSDGTTVRAQDFVTSWRREVDRNFSLPTSNDIKTLAGAEEIIAGTQPTESLGVAAASDTILVVKLARPVAYFLELLAHSAMMPVFSDASARSHQAKKLVSNGPYELEAWHPGEGLKLKRNAHYWNRESVKIGEINYLVITNQDAQFAAYRSGQIDITDTVPPAALKEYGSAKSHELFVSPYLATAYYGLNFLSQNVGKNLSLRTALAMAIDRKRLVSSMGLGQIPAYGLVPPGIWNYSSQSFSWSLLSDHDRTAAAKIWYLKAGYSKEKPLRLRLLINASPSIKQTALIVAAMWKDALGVETVITDEEFRVFLQSRKDSQTWDVIRLAWNADFNDASSFLETFTSGSHNNDTRFGNSAFDALIDVATRSIDLNKRRAHLESAERLLLSDYPIVPLYFFVSKHLVKPYVIGFRSNPYDRIESKSLGLHYANE